LTAPLRMVRANNPSPMTLDGTRSFIVGAREGVVVDPGPADPRHLSSLLEEISGRLVAILLTHDHPDHAAGAEALAERTGAPVRGGGGARPELHEGERFETDAGPLTAVATPGHAPDHFAFLWEGEGGDARALFVGDLLMGEGDTTVVMAPEGDLTAYLRSLDRVEGLAPTRLYPAHGPPLDDPGGALRRYRAHREERLAQVEAALRRAGRARPEELLAEVYGELDPRLAGAARGSLECALDWLVKQGRAARDGGSDFIPTGGNHR
jgi:glyoxylase-like metal-dependent hydrolase (beta-lactamase superfamily II)